MLNGKLRTANLVLGGALEGHITDRNGNTLVYVDGQLGYANTEFNPENGFCRACLEYVQWTALTADTNTKNLAAGHYHYYVPETMTHTGPQLFAVSSADHTFCLYLNGKVLTLSNSISGSWSTNINIMGPGELKKTEGKLIDMYSATVNFFGGIYTAPQIVDLSYAQASKAFMYEGTTVNGIVSVGAMGSLSIYNEAVLSDLRINSWTKPGLTTFASRWTGSAKLTVDTSLLTTENKIAKTTAVFNATWNNQLSSDQGAVSVSSNQITITPNAAE